MVTGTATGAASTVHLRRRTAPGTPLMGLAATGFDPRELAAPRSSDGLSLSEVMHPARRGAGPVDGATR
jgi:hypothetical protein